MYHIIIADSVLAKKNKKLKKYIYINFLFFCKFFKINRRAPEGPHSCSARLLGHIRYMMEFCLLVIQLANQVRPAKGSLSFLQLLQ